MPGNRMRAWAPGGGWPSAKRLARPATYQPYSQVQPLGGAPFAAKGPAGPGGAHRPEAKPLQAKDRRAGCREASRSLETPRKFFAQRPRIKTGAVRALRARLDRWRGPTPPEESNPQVKPPARNIRGGLTWGLPNRPGGPTPPARVSPSLRSGRPPVSSKLRVPTNAGARLILRTRLGAGPCYHTFVVLGIPQI